MKQRPLHLLRQSQGQLRIRLPWWTPVRSRTGTELVNTPPNGVACQSNLTPDLGMQGAEYSMNSLCFSLMILITFKVQGILRR